MSISISRMTFVGCDACWSQLWQRVCCWWGETLHVWYFCVQEDSDLLGLRLFLDQQSRLLKDFSEHLELSVSALKQDVAAIVRRKRERSGIWS